MGGFIGFLHSGNVTNSYCTGNVTAPTFEMVGGFAGWAWDCTITNCWASGSIDAGSNAGGFIGWASDILGDYAHISYCYSTGDVAVSDWAVAGGFCAWNDTAVIEECYALGDVSTTGSGDWDFGAFIGVNDGTTQNCYSRGTVSTSDNTNYEAGGFCGWNDATIIACYSTEAVTGFVTDYGGFCGVNDDNITACFWDTEASGIDTSDGGVGQDTDNMTTIATFTDALWDFDAIWCMPRAGVNDGYPILRNNLPPLGSCSYCADAMYETYKEVSSSDKPLWYQALPSILKLLYVGFILTMAVVILRRKPKDDEPDYADLGD